MPTYQYRCTNCGHEIEAVQKFSDPALTTCDQCQGALRKVFSPVGVVFKGSGFYATDNRSKSKGSGAAPTTSDKGGDKTGDAAGKSGDASKDAGSASTASTGGDSAASSTSTPASTPKPTAGGSTGGSTTA